MAADISDPTMPDASVSVEPKRLNVFERYLSLWVALCMVAGVALGRLAPGLISQLRGLGFGSDSQINAPIAVLIWLMIVPMMLKIDFTSIARIGRRPTGLFVTLFVNWLVKPFGMAFLGWLFFKHLFLPIIGPELADQYTAGVIILAAAPCTAMVFVWSYLCDGDPAYTLVQVSVNDLIMLVLFAPIVRFLVSGASNLEVPFQVLLMSVLVFIVIPLTIGVVVRQWFVRNPRARLVRAAVPAAVSAGGHHGASRHAGAHLRLPGGQSPQPSTAHRAHRSTDPDPGLFQLVPDLRPDAALPGSVPGSGPWGPHRGEQLLRTGCGNGDRALRPRIGCGPRYGGRRPGRSTGDALGLRRLQPDAGMVRRSRCLSPRRGPKI